MLQVRYPKMVRTKSHSRKGNADDAHREVGAKKSTVTIILQSVKNTRNILKSFTLEYEERTVFNDAVMPNF